MNATLGIGTRCGAGRRPGLADMGDDGDERDVTKRDLRINQRDRLQFPQSPQSRITSPSHELPLRLHRLKTPRFASKI
jgi:hypothetical protein